MKRIRNLWLWVWLAILMVANGFLFTERGRLLKAHEHNVAVADTLGILRDDLALRFNQVQKEVDSLKKENERLGLVSLAQSRELDERKNRIAKLLDDLSGEKIDRATLDFATEELARLTKARDHLQGLLLGDNDETGHYIQANINLMERNDTLLTNLARERDLRSEAQQALQLLRTRAQRLEEENRGLSAEVDRARVIGVAAISGTGIKIRPTGGEKTTQQAALTDKLRVCLDLAPNPLANKGDESFYLRIISPGGGTLALDNMGSGTLRERVSGTEVVFTTYKSVAYTGESQNVCMVWRQPGGFAAGHYQVEVYNKGFLAGKGTFTLK